MYDRPLYKQKESVGNATLILAAFATAFFPRLFTYFGAPAPLNFVHFIVVPTVSLIAIATTKITNRRQINLFQELLFACGILFTATLASTIVTQAGVANMLLQYMLLTEPFILLLGIIAIPLTGKRLEQFKTWIIGFGLSNLGLALVQSVLMPIGLYPRRGGTLQDNIAGVFASGSGSAGNYISCTVSIYFALYILNFSKCVPIWLKYSLVAASFYQAYVSDSKQVLLGLLLGFFLMTLSKVENPGKILKYLIPLVLFLAVFVWALKNPDIQFLSAYRNWTNRAHLYSFEGDAFQTKTAAFRIIPTHYDSALNWLFGLGPGHSVSRLGGWMIKKYADLLAPLGVTLHPASDQVFQVVRDGWIAKESTIFFPLFTWAGIWGDLGLVGLFSYLYVCVVVWRGLCQDDVCRFMVLSTAVLGFMLTQMEEPGQMLTVVCLLGLRWHERQAERQSVVQAETPQSPLSKRKPDFGPPLLEGTGG